MNSGLLWLGKGKPQCAMSQDDCAGVSLSEGLREETGWPVGSGCKPAVIERIDWKASREQVEALSGNLLGGDLPFIEHAVRYLIRQYRRNCHPNTLKSNLADLKCFLRFIKEEGKSRLEEFDRKSLEAFVEYEQDRGMKPASVKHRVTTATAFVRFLAAEGLISPELVGARRIRIKVPESLPRAMNPEDVRKLLSVIDHVRNRAMVLILLRTGMRIGEVLHARVQDIDLKSRKILIYEASKTGIGRVVYFSNDAKEALEAWLKEKDPRGRILFCKRNLKPLSYAGARAMFRRNLKKAGLLDKGYTIHCLRHTYASELLNAGMRLECLQPLLGHTNLEVTRRYARLTDKTREEEYFRAMAVIEKGGVGGRYQCDN